MSTQELNQKINRELGIAEERSNEGYVFGTEIFLGRIDKYAERLGTDVSNFVTDEKRNQIMRTALEKGIHRELGIAEERSNEGYVFGTRLQLEQAEKYAQELRNHPRSVKEIRASNYPMKFFDEAILRLKYYDNSDETLQEGFDLKGKQYDVQLNLNSLILSNKIKKARKELLEN